MDIAAEEFFHAEIVATTISLLNGHDPQAMNANVEAHVLTGWAPFSECPRTIVLRPDVRMGPVIWMPMSNIAAEQRAQLSMNTCIGRLVTNMFAIPSTFC